MRPARGKQGESQELENHTKGLRRKCVQVKNTFGHLAGCLTEANTE